MKKAKILENCEFIVMLRTSLSRQFTHQEQVLLDGVYDRFLARVERISQGSMSKLEKLRLFTRTVKHWNGCAGISGIRRRAATFTHSRQFRF